MFVGDHAIYIRRTNQAPLEHELQKVMNDFSYCAQKIGLHFSHLKIVAIKFQLAKYRPPPSQSAAELTKPSFIV